MQTTLKPGKYVVAVSGGVDSMALLDALSKQPGVELIVAHFEHGIREDSDEDRKLVQEAAQRYELPFVSEHGDLGPNASEAEARSARYGFLRNVRQMYHADAIVTAHHQDDLVETAIINMIRGTGRKGLSSLSNQKDLIRPLLHIPKSEILDYAKSHQLIWHEDSTNQNEAYLRNYVRRTILPKLGVEGKEKLLGLIERAEEHNPVIDELLLQDIKDHEATEGLNRYWFIMLPHAVACEAMATWLREKGIREFDSKAIDRLVVGAKVAIPGKQVDINAGCYLKVGKTTLQVIRRTPS
jgi:tRNA(Ile)-lysidine synthetase-like protein